MKKTHSDDYYNGKIDYLIDELDKSRFLVTSLTMKNAELKDQIFQLKLSNAPSYTQSESSGGESRNKEKVYDGDISKQ